MAAAARHTSPHQFGQFLRRAQRRLLPMLDNAFGNAPTEAILAKLPDQIGQLAFAQLRQKRAGWLAGRPIQAHVERAVLLKSEAALNIVELR